jgi:hypothetical protein
LSGAKLLVADSAQGIFGANDGDTGIRWETGDVLAIDTAGAERVTIYDSVKVNNVYLSIDPTEKFYLDGGNNTYIEEDSADTMIFATGGTTALTLDSTQQSTFTRAGDVNDNKATLKVENTGIHGMGISVYANTANDSNPLVQIEQAHADASMPALRVIQAGDGDACWFGESGGNVGIGSTAPAEQLHIHGLNPMIRLNTTSGTGIAGINFSEGDALKWSMGLLASTDEFHIGEDSQNMYTNKRLTIANTSGDVTVNTGDLIFGTAGKGICLGVTSNTDANTLDDYEEGTFTGTWTAGTDAPTNPQTNTMYYTKIGNQVTCWIAFANKDLSGASGGMSITGLPFTASSASNIEAPCSTMFFFGLWIDPDKVQTFRVAGGTTYLEAYASSAAAWSAWDITAGSQKYLKFTVTYFV